MPSDQRDSLIDAIGGEGSGDDQEQEKAEVTYHEPLWLSGAHDSAGNLRAAILSGQVVDNLEICVNQSFVESPGAALSLFVRASGFPGLRSLRIFPEINSSTYELPIHLLTITLRQASDLAIFSICGMDLTGNAAEFRSFQRSLQRHSSLSFFRLIRGSIPSDNSDHLNSLLGSLSEIPHLREIELSAAEEASLGDLSDESLQLLYNSPHLKKFRLDNFSFVEQQVLPLFHALETNLHLQGILVSSAQCSDVGLQAIVSMIRNNNSLEEFSFCISPSEGDDTTFGSEGIILDMADALQHHPSLKHFRLSHSGTLPKLGQAGKDAFLYAVQHNYNIENLFLWESTALDPKVNFYLSLNRMGRKRLVEEDATRDDLIDVLINAEVDLNCLYHIIAMKPQLLGDIIE